MGKEKEKETKRCLIKIIYEPISSEEKVELLRVLRDKGPYCTEMLKLFKK